VEQIPCVVWVTDRALRITSVIGQASAWKRAGWDREHAIGVRLQRVLGTDDPHDPVIELHAAALRGAAGALSYHLGARWFDVHVEPVRHESQEIVGCIGAAVDVTERELARQEAARSEAKLVEAQRIAHVGHWEWNVPQDRVSWSDELHRIYGVAPGAFAGTYEAFLEHVFPEDREHTRSVIFAAFRSAKPFKYDHRIVRADGSVGMLHTLGAVTTDDHGKVIRMAGACWDITELWDAQQTAERSLSLLHATLESTADALLAVDCKGNVVTYNHRLLELWNLAPNEVDHSTFDALRARIQDQLANPEVCMLRAREIESQREAESFDSLHFLDGRVFERYSRPQRVGADIVGRVWSYRDVTEREQLLRSAVFLSDASRLLANLDEEEALDAVGRLSLTYFADACAVDLFTAGAPRRIVTLSRDSSQSLATELPRAALLGNPVIQQVGPRSSMAVPIVAHGETIGVLSFAAPLGRTYTTGDLSVANELARRIELALDNARLYRSAREALAARDEFLGVAAHEIRGPLTALQLAIEGLPGARGDAVPRLVATVEREVRRLARFVDEMFDVAKVRSGQLEFNFAPVDIVEVTREVTERLSGDLTRSSSSLSTSEPASLVGVWDRARLVEVVTNLLSNAIKFGLGKPIAIEIDNDRTSARWSITDRGIGIPTDARERIFHPFERAVSVRYYGGLGLGLFIVRSIVDALGGSIGVESTPGAGSKFTVVLPLRRAA
jgi:signal transduction histidine kinase/PAS domain-containing protein